MYKNIIVILLSIIAMVSCAAPLTGNTIPKKEELSVPQALIEETIAFVSPDSDDEWTVDCGGVWVDWNIILTAYHCIGWKKAPNTDGTGAEFYFSTKENFDVLNKGSNEHHAGMVVAIDKDQDIALVRVINANMKHRTVSFATKNPNVGEIVILMGHPDGCEYSYTHGYVSGFYSSIKSDSILAKGPFIKINAVVVGGNSGGGAFNAEGQLIGIVSFTKPRAIQQGFIIPLSSIKKLLEDYEKNKKTSDLNKTAKHI